MSTNGSKISKNKNIFTRRIELSNRYQFRLLKFLDIMLLEKNLYGSEQLSFEIVSAFPFSSHSTSRLFCFFRFPTSRPVFAFSRHGYLEPCCSIESSNLKLSYVASFFKTVQRTLSHRILCQYQQIQYLLGPYDPYLIPVLFWDEFQSYTYIFLIWQIKQ